MPRNRVKISRGERTRQSILDAAEMLFLTQGYNGTSMRQIARKAGNIAVGGIYNHFGSKEEIFRALLKARSPYAEIIETLESLESESGDELLAEAFSRIQAIMQRHLRFINLALIDFQETDGSTFREMVSGVIPYTLRFARQLRASGCLRDDINEFDTLWALVSMMIGYTLTQIIAYKDEQPLLDGIPEGSEEESRSVMLDIFLHGVAANGEGN